MDKTFGTYCRQALVFALVTTLGLAVVPYLCQPAANFLGKDVSDLAAGVVAFYPWSAVAEAAKIFVLAALVAFAAGLLTALAADQLRTMRWAMYPLVPLCAYLLWFGATALSYPALFESSLPSGMQRALFHLSFSLKPAALLLGAGNLMILPLLVLANTLTNCEGRKRVLGALLMACSLAADIWLIYCQMPDDLGQTAGTTVESEKPNVLFIGVDSLRADRLKRGEVTPALISLLSDPQTVSFQDHYVGVPRTFPSWLEILQGRFAPQTGIRHMFPGFKEREKPFVSWVSKLREAGYHTTVRSDFAGDIFPRFETGFEQVLAPKLTIMTMIRLSVDQGLVGFLPLMTMGPWRSWFPALKESPAYGDAQQLGSGLRAKLGEDGGAKGPWLETIFFSTAHFPYAAPFPYYSRFADKSYEGPYRFQKNPDLSAGSDTADKAEVAQVRALYDGAVLSIDTEIGRILAALKRSGQWDSTLIVVSADHGEELFERDHLQGHGEQLRGERVLKVPLLLKMPARRKVVESKISFTTRSIDIAATVLGAVGLPGGLAGSESTDLTPWVVGEQQKAPNLTAYSETGLWFSRGGSAYFQRLRLDYPGISGMLNFDQGYSGEITLRPSYQQTVVTAKHRMLLEGDYKLLYMPTPTQIHYELYNRRTDPDNFYDLSMKEPHLLRGLQQKLADFIQAHEGEAQRLADGYVVPR